MIREIVSRCFGALLIAFGVVGIAAAVYSGGFLDGAFAWRHIAVAVVSVVVLFMGWGRLFPTYYAPIPIDPEDPLMKEAIIEARRNVARFEQGVADGKKQAFVKFRLNAMDGPVEHIWAIVHALKDGMAQVSLANDPVRPQGERDPRFSIALADIEDWILVDAHGATEGGYTHLAMARIYKKDKGHIPLAMRKQLSSFKDIDLGKL